MLVRSSKGYSRTARIIFEYMLYPEFKFPAAFAKEFKSVLNKILITAILVCFAHWLYSTRMKIRSLADKSYNDELIIKNLHRRIFLRDSILNSQDYMRFDLFKQTGVAIPKKVPYSHMMKIVETAKKEGIKLSIVLKVIKMESNFDSNAINSKTGAFGYMQLMPRTFSHYSKKLGLSGDKLNPEENLKCGCRMLKQNFDYWYKRKRDEKEAWRLSLACYLMGEELPRKLGRVPKSKEAEFYINNILKDETF